jgi:hypothetical protein
LPANGDFAAAHLLPGPPRSPASRLLRTLRRRLQTLRSPKVAGVSRINCRSALAREGDGAAAHLSSDPPRSPASRLLRTLRFAGKPAPADFAFRRRLPMLPGSTVGARLPAKAMVLRRTCCLIHRVRQQAGSYELCVSPASRRLQTLRSPKFAGVARINVGARLPANGDLAAAHLSPDPPRSPASRLLRTLHFASKPAPADFAFTEGCRCCPDQL